MLAERTEGNLLACAQELDKLLMLRGPGAVSAAEAEAGLADAARFDAFTLAEAVRGGDAARAVRICRGIEAEGQELPMVVGALAREIRILAQLAAGEPAQAVFREHKVFGDRAQAYSRAARRLTARRWLGLLGQLGGVDRAAKGRAGGVSGWAALAALVAAACGVGEGAATADPV